VPGQVFVITAPSGTGKTTLLKALFRGDPKLRFSISYTTRPPRPGEVPGRDYFFVTPEEFRRLREDGALVEYVEQFGFAYGTSREWVVKTLAQGVDLVFDLDSRGAREMKREFPQGTFVFILPPSLEQLELRLKLRGDLSPGELRARLSQGLAELREADWYDFLVVNDDLSTALEELKAIVAAARCRTSQRWPEWKPRLIPSAR
jgi:guanylate kinase